MLLCGCWQLPLPVAAEGMGEWQIYPCYSTITQIEPTGNKVYAVSNGNLYAYNVTDGSYEVIDKSNYLNDLGIQCVKWSQVAKSLIVVYDNSNIDILYADGETVNLSELSTKQMTVSRNVNNVRVFGKYAYLCGEFGVMKIDMAEGYICDTYNIHRMVYDVYASADKIYALVPGTILQANVKENLMDRSAWKEFTNIGSDPFTEMTYINGKFIIGNPGYCNAIDIASVTSSTFLIDKYTWNSCTGGKYLCGKDDIIYISDNGQAPKKYSSVGFTCTSMAYDQKNNCFWGNDGAGALTKYVMEEDAFVAKSTGVKPVGPPSLTMFRMAMAGNKLLVTGGSSTYTVSSEYNPGCVMQLDGDKWSEYENTGAIVDACGRYRAVNNVIVDPHDQNHVFASARTGLYEFRNGKFVKRWGHEDGLLIYDNDPSKPYHIMTSTMAFDDSNNLWFTDNWVTTPLYCITANGQLKNFPKVSASDATFFFDCEGLSVHGNDVWFGNEHRFYPGFYHYNMATDKFSEIHNFFNQDNAQLSVENIYTTAVDKDGNVWVGTSAGPFYITPEDYDDMIFTQHKVPRNDGTNLADYLLANVVVRKIFIDPANRKWIGTSDDGVYVISSDCNVQLHHFTKDNSPLISNMIYDIVLDEKTGRVYITTDKGLCSFRSDVSKSYDELVSDNVYAYPNPVTPDFTGDITVVGLSDGCDVKVITVSGELVASGTANGGTFIWNGRNMNGDRAASGVYVVCATTSDGNSGAVTKIAVVR